MNKRVRNWPQSLSSMNHPLHTICPGDITEILVLEKLESMQMIM